MKGVLITALVLAGILLISNVDKGVERYARDRIQVMVGPGTPLETVVQEFESARVIDEEKGIVGIPENETMFYVRKFEREHSVMFASQIPMPPEFKWSVYQSRLKKMIQNYTAGDLPRARQSVRGRHSAASGRLCGLGTPVQQGYKLAKIGADVRLSETITGGGAILDGK
ncbi:hypothetical protein CBW65_05560 [Tumebacillus avium]|uniref:Uncharacterized protein n=1 Tax=Tumebacillus avium TaxID=1903704 RepID=A0A1Y0IJG5_9BACL|nr:hypothetical protein [Tumebacillus avium]ARU60607.1 hypothetical protein CBW65_05560 [Tumebacillus avium]